jgi:hypothetical protein
MATAREIMTADVRCVRASETVLDAANRLAELGVGALPICGEDNRLKGMLTRPGHRGEGVGGRQGPEGGARGRTFRVTEGVITNGKLPSAESVGCGT